MDALPPPRRNFLLGLGLTVAVILRLTKPQGRRVPPPQQQPANGATAEGQPAPSGPSPLDGDALTERARTALQRVLATEPAGAPVWIAATAASPGSVRVAEELATVFRRAGWRVAEVARLDWAVRPGFYVYAGDVTAPPYFETVKRALVAAGIEATVGTDYRAYYRERSELPNWRGVQMAPDQTWVLLVGRVQ